MPSLLIVVMPPPISIATNYIKFLVFYGLSHGTALEKNGVAQNIICTFKNLINYFLKLSCLFTKHKQCQIGKIDQFLTINQLKIQITENFKCQQQQSTEPSIQLKFLWNQPRLPSIIGGGIAAKNGWEGWAHLDLP